MFEKQNYSNFPNELVDKYMTDLSGSELKLLMTIIRQTVGWHKSNDWITTSQYIKKTGLSNRCVIDGLRSLEEKTMIEVTFICEKCKTVIKHVELPFECPACSNKEYPTKYYQLSVNYKNNGIENPPKEKQKLPDPVQKAHNPSAESSQTPALKVHDPVNKVHDPCDENSQPPVILFHTQNKLMQNKLIQKSSSSEKLTKEDPGAVLENFDFTEDDDEFSQKSEKKAEEKRAEGVAIMVIEKQYPAYFANNGAVPEFKRTWLADIGKKPVNEIENALLNVASSLKNPAKLIEFMHKKLYVVPSKDPVPIEQTTNVDKLASLFRNVMNADDMWRILRQIAKISVEMSQSEVYEAAFKEIDLLDPGKTLDWFVAYCHAA